MAEIVWTEPALSDLDAIADYIALDNPEAARQFVRRVFEQVEHLQQHPELGSRPPEFSSGRHRQLIEPPCRIFYRYDGQLVLVPHIMRSEQLLRPNKLRARSRTMKPGRPRRS